ncbi:MAG: hypothetical protein A2261_00735 [Candidatus Magasanikbacteria bacterium RIFOXYA2_FULL_44_8]|uniref:Glycosyl transferase family 1 domain-containing protein n=1 Tax=Candidatus Magasanikbacteria bacterium RIFOXYA2_FULL_44_8 TaxID=1798696 RepID=A0A1F6NKK3_9BACT|nr:MAG: hypothetical protein A2261_00735 [Candidatus Magasanikbacteria bacterium RIFOXYA2_FULL_44_8]
MRIALVHDYLSQNGGAERVLKAMHEIWPEAPIFVLFHDPKKIDYIPTDKIRESFLAKFPGIHQLYQWYLPWMPIATERHDLHDYDIVISSSSAFAKGIITPPQTLHISYCHTPPRFLWADTHQYVADLKYNFLIKSFLPGLIHRMRLWDSSSANRVDHFLANSRTVAQRIQKYYRRPSDVIYPPVDTHQFTPQKNIGDFYLAGGRLVPYKRLDMIIETFNRLQWPLKIFGVGPEMARLKKYARPNIEFLGQISEHEKADLMAQTRGYLNPQIEDCGITAIEAMAAGRPVIAFAEGGATETIIPNETGVYFYGQTWEKLLDTLLHFDHTAWDSDKIRAHAQKYNVDHFKQNLQQFVHDRFEEFQKGLNQESLLRYEYRH